MMIERDVTPELKRLAQDYPIVTVIGPRQSGKTTLVRHVFSQLPYVNLEMPEVRAAAQSDPRSLLAKYPQGMILDEIQRVPELLSYLQVIVDEQNKNNQKSLFILTGSHQLELRQALSQSLAGRTALLTLYPLSLGELKAVKLNFSVDDYLLHGFYPRIYQNKLDPTRAYRNYFQTYVERDVRQLINIKNISLFEKFMKLCAGRIGQVLNNHSLSNDLGISSHTVKQWLSILEASFVIFQLQPYFENLGKRLIKSPKLYFVDVGLASYLLDIEDTRQLNRDPLRGNLFENMIVLELLKIRLNQGKDPHLYYYRNNNQQEVDIIYKSGHALTPIEIKSAQTFHPEFIKNLQFFEKMAAGRVSEGYVIYAGAEYYKIKNFVILNYLSLKKF